MATLKTDEVNLRVVIDGTPARKELANLDQSIVTTRDRIKELTAEQERLRDVLKGSKQYSEEYVAASKAMEKNRQELVQLRSELSASTERASELRKEIGISALSVRELRNEASKLRVLRDTASGGSQAYKDFDARLTEVNARIKVLTNDAAKQAAAWEAVRGQYKLSQMSMQQLEMEANRLRTALHTMSPEDAGFAKLRADLKATEAQMAATRTGLGMFGRAWESVRSNVVGTMAGVGALFAGGAAMQGIRGWITGAADLSDQMADVRRTTGLTDAQVQSLSKSLKEMDTRTPRSELLALAADAGKLGISAEKDVLGFVRAGNQIRVSLGDDLGDDAIKSIGKLTQTFKIGEQRGFDLEKSLLSTGSAINALGQSSTAAEAYLVDFTTRMAGVNVQAGISIENTLGYAAATDQLGLKVETTTTALSQFTLKAFKNPADYAKIAGMAVKDFTKLLNEDTNEALLRTLEGLHNNNEGLSTMVAKFGDLGQEGARAVGVLSALSGQTKLVREQQQLSNKAFAEGTSITQEYQVKNQNFAANLEKIGRAMHGWFVNSTVVNWFKDLSDVMVKWMAIPVSKKLEEERLELMKTEAQIISYNVGTKERTKLIKELQAQYPGFLANIDAETVGNDQLRLAVSKLNQELVNKIILQKQDEKIQQQAEQQAEQQIRVLAKEDDVRERMVKMAQKYNLTIKEGVPLLQQAQDMERQVQEERKKTGTITKGVVVDSFARYQHAIAELAISYSFLNSEEKRSNDLAREREELMKRLGINTTPTPLVKPTPPAFEAPDDDAGDLTDKERAAALKAMEALRADLQKLRRQIELDAMSADEREIAQLDDKYAELRKKILENELHTQRDLDAWRDTYEDARAELLTKQAEERAAKVAAAKLKANQDAQKAEDAYWLSQLDDEDKAITQEMQRLDQLSALYEAAGLDTQDIVRRTEEAIAAIRKDFREKERKAADEAAKLAFENQVKTYQAVAGSLGAMNDLLAASYQAAAKENYQQTVAAKTLGLAQIGIASGIGVAQAIKAGSGIPWPGNLGAIASGVAAVLGGIANAIALLSNVNPTPPSEASTPSSATAINAVPIGEDGLVLDGPSHRNKGLAVINSQTGEQEAELEGGELVMSKAFTEANRDQLPALLAASKAGSRIKFLTTPPAPINVAAYQQAERTVRLADGGLLGNVVASPAPQATTPSTDPVLVQELRAIGSKLDKLDDLIEVSAQQKNAVLRLGPDTDQVFEEWEKLKDRNTIRRR